MITGIHAMFFTPGADALRPFIRDTLGIPATDTGDGWLIFRAPAGEIGCHPDESVRHDVSFTCDDIGATVEELKSKGVEFTTEVKDYGYGPTTRFLMPGGVEVELYQPNYKLDD